MEHVRLPVHVQRPNPSPPLHFLFIWDPVKNLVNYSIGMLTHYIFYNGSFLLTYSIQSFHSSIVKQGPYSVEVLLQRTGYLPGEKIVVIFNLAREKHSPLSISPFITTELIAVSWELITVNVSGKKRGQDENLNMVPRVYLFIPIIS